MEDLKYKPYKVPAIGERTFIVREKGDHHRTLWLDRTYIAEIKLSRSTYQSLTEDIWRKTLSGYEHEGLRCVDFVIERNFNSLDELNQYLAEGGRITNLDEGFSCYVRLVNGKYLFDNGEELDERAVILYPTSWKPFYAPVDVIEKEKSKLISSMLRKKG